MSILTPRVVPYHYTDSSAVHGVTTFIQCLQLNATMPATIWDLLKRASQRIYSPFDNCHKQFLRIFVFFPQLTLDTPVDETYLFSS